MPHLQERESGAGAREFRYGPVEKLSELERWKESVMTRTLELGDKVAGALTRNIYEVIESGVVYTEVLDDEGKKWTLLTENMQPLPPWIDEPHPTGEIQRVFESMYEEDL